ncbi:MAG: hypothetical protein KKD29_05130, partial [Candidatus Omnitrophica bacterium]|nr:hypothetical protein [Candidatus Omnitrophota bacterium]
MITTEKTGIDLKGGQIGIEISADGKVALQIMELGTAEANGQKDLFSNMGLPGGEGQAGRQYFNTNTLLINESVLKSFLEELIALVGKERFIDIITPNLITKDQSKNGKDFTKLEGTISSVLINLNAFLAKTDDTRIRQLMDNFGIEKLLYIVNTSKEERSDFFTPVKLAWDFWLQAYSDQYTLDTTNWVLTDNNPSLIPSFELTNGYYKEVKNCIDAFGNASTVALDKLTINGIVNLKDSVLIGNVVIGNMTGSTVDLNGADFRSKLAALTNSGLIPILDDGRLVLADIKINIGAGGEVTLEKIGSSAVQNTLDIIQNISDRLPVGASLNQKEETIISTLSKTLNSIFQYVPFHDYGVRYVNPEVFGIIEETARSIFDFTIFSYAMVAVNFKCGVTFIKNDLGENVKAFIENDGRYGNWVYHDHPFVPNDEYIKRYDDETTVIYNRTNLNLKSIIRFSSPTTTFMPANFGSLTSVEAFALYIIMQNEPEGFVTTFKIGTDTYKVHQITDGIEVWKKNAGGIITIARYRQASGYTRENLGTSDNIKFDALGKNKMLSAAELLAKIVDGDLWVEDSALTDNLATFGAGTNENASRIQALLTELAQAGVEIRFFRGVDALAFREGNIVWFNEWLANANQANAPPEMAIIVEGLLTHQTKHNSTKGTLYEEWMEEIEAVSAEVAIYAAAIKTTPAVKDNIRQLLNSRFNLNDIVADELLNIAERRAYSAYIAEFVTKYYKEFSAYNYPILQPAYVGHDIGVCNVVNPNHEAGKVALYGGAGTDISNFLLSMDATEGYFLDALPVSTAELKSYLTDWDYIGLEEDDSTYYVSKWGEGFGRYSYFSEKIEWFILAELKALGVKKEDISIEITAEGSARLRFKWAYPGYAEKEYSITFIHIEDITSPAGYPRELNDVLLDGGIDIYYQRAGQSMPEFYHDFMPRIGTALRIGGYCITSDYTVEVEPHNPEDYLQQDGAQFTRDEDLRSPSMLKWEEAIYNSRKTDYGWHVKIRQKVFEQEFTEGGRLKKVYYDDSPAAWEEYKYDSAGKCISITLYNPRTGEKIIVVPTSSDNDGQWYAIYSFEEGAGATPAIGHLIVEEGTRIVLKDIHISANLRGNGVGTTIMRWLNMKAYRGNKKFIVSNVISPWMAHLAEKGYLYDGLIVQKGDDTIESPSESELNKLMLEGGYKIARGSEGVIVRVINADTGEMDISGLPTGYTASIEDMRLIVRNNLGEEVELWYETGYALYFEGSVDVVRIYRDMKMDSYLRQPANAIKVIASESGETSQSKERIKEATEALYDLSESGEFYDYGVAYVSPAALAVVKSVVNLAIDFVQPSALNLKLGVTFIDNTLPADVKTHIAEQSRQGNWCYYYALAAGDNFKLYEDGTEVLYDMSMGFIGINWELANFNPVNFNALTSGEAALLHQIMQNEPDGFYTTFKIGTDTYKVHQIQDGIEIWKKNTIGITIARYRQTNVYTREDFGTSDNIKFDALGKNKELSAQELIDIINSQTMTGGDDDIWVQDDVVLKTNLSSFGAGANENASRINNLLAQLNSAGVEICFFRNLDTLAFRRGNVIWLNEWLTKANQANAPPEMAIILEGLLTHQAKHNSTTGTLYEEWMEEIEATAAECAVYTNAIKANPAVKDNIRQLLNNRFNLNDIIVDELLDIAEKGASSTDIAEFVTRYYKEFSAYNYPILQPAYAGHDIAVCNVVNPNHEAGKVAVYAGSGADVINFGLSLDATEGYFVDYFAPSRLELENALANWYDIGSDILDTRYTSNKRFFGYAQTLQTASGLARAVILELKAIGVKREDVFIEETDAGSARIRFKWAYPGSLEKEYTITFISGDITYPQIYSEELNAVLSRGIDVYYQRAALDVPKEYASFISYIGDAIKTGGYCVTDDYSFSGDTPSNPEPYLEANGSLFTHDEELKSLSMDKWKDILQKMGSSPYGWHVKIRQKLWDKNEPQTILSFLETELLMSSPNAELITKAIQALDNLPQSATLLEYGVYFASQNVLNKIAEVLPSLMTGSHPRALALKNGLVLINYALEAGKKIYAYIHEITHQVVGSIYGSAAIIDSAVAARYNSGIVLVQAAVSQVIYWDVLAGQLGILRPMSEKSRLKVLNEALARRMELSQKGAKGELTSEENTFLITLQTLLDNPVIDDLYIEIQAILQENRLITPGLLEAMASESNMPKMLLISFDQMSAGLAARCKTGLPPELKEYKGYALMKDGTPVAYYLYGADNNIISVEVVTERAIDGKYYIIQQNVLTADGVLTPYYPRVLRRASDSALISSAGSYHKKAINSFLAQYGRLVLQNVAINANGYLSPPTYNDNIYVGNQYKYKTAELILDAERPVTSASINTGNADEPDNVTFMWKNGVDYAVGEPKDFIIGRTTTPAKGTAATELNRTIYIEGDIGDVLVYSSTSKILPETLNAIGSCKIRGGVPRGLIDEKRDFSIAFAGKVYRIPYVYYKNFLTYELQWDKDSGRPVKIIGFCRDGKRIELSPIWEEVWGVAGNSKDGFSFTAPSLDIISFSVTEYDGNNVPTPQPTYNYRRVYKTIGDETHLVHVAGQINISAIEPLGEVRMFDIPLNENNKETRLRVGENLVFPLSFAGRTCDVTLVDGKVTTIHFNPLNEEPAIDVEVMRRGDIIIGYESSEGPVRQLKLIWRNTAAYSELAGAYVNIDQATLESYGSDITITNITLSDKISIGDNICYLPPRLHSRPASVHLINGLIQNIDFPATDTEPAAELIIEHETGHVIRLITNITGEEPYIDDFYKIYDSGGNLIDTYLAYTRNKKEIHKQLNASSFTGKVTGFYTDEDGAFEYDSRVFVDQNHPGAKAEAYYENGEVTRIELPDFAVTLYVDAVLAQKIEENIGLAVKVARPYFEFASFFGITPDELIQSAGRYGLARAFKTFDPENGCPFSSYASSGIKFAVEQYIYENSGAKSLKISSVNFWLYRKLFAVESQLIHGGIYRPSAEDIAICYLKNSHNEVPTTDEVEDFTPKVEEYLSQKHLLRNAFSLNVAPDESESNPEWSTIPQDTEPEPVSGLIRLEAHGKVQEALASLSKIKQQIVRLKLFNAEELTWGEIGEKIGYSHTWAHQKYIEALSEIKTYLNGNGFNQQDYDELNFPLYVSGEADGAGDYVSLRRLSGMDGAYDIIDWSNASYETMRAFTAGGVDTAGTSADGGIMGAFEEALKEYGEYATAGLDEIRIKKRILPPGETNEDIFARFFSSENSKILEINRDLADYPKSFQKMVMMHDLAHYLVDTLTMGTAPGALAETACLLYTLVNFMLKKDSSGEILYTLGTLVNEHPTEANKALLKIFSSVNEYGWIDEDDIVDEELHLFNKVIDYVNTYLYPDTPLVFSGSLYGVLGKISDAVQYFTPLMIKKISDAEYGIMPIELVDRNGVPILYNWDILVRNYPDYAWRILSILLSASTENMPQWLNGLIEHSLFAIDNSDPGTEDGAATINNYSKVLDSFLLATHYTDHSVLNSLVLAVDQSTIDKINKALSVEPRTEHPEELSLKSGLIFISRDNPALDGIAEEDRQAILEAKSMHGAIHYFQMACRDVLENAAYRLSRKEKDGLGQPVQYILNSLPAGSNVFDSRMDALRALMGYGPAETDMNVLREAFAVLAEIEILLEFLPDKVNKTAWEDLYSVLGMKHVSEGLDPANPNRSYYIGTITEVTNLMSRIKDIIREGSSIPSGTLSTAANVFSSFFLNGVETRQNNTENPTIAAVNAKDYLTFVNFAARDAAFNALADVTTRPTEIDSRNIIDYIIKED